MPPNGDCSSQSKNNPFTGDNIAYWQLEFLNNQHTSFIFSYNHGYLPKD